MRPGTQHVEPHPLTGEILYHAHRALEAEGCFLSDMLDDPVAGWTAACDSRVNHTDFLDKRNAKLFDALCYLALEGIEPELWLVRELMRLLGFPFLHEGTANDELNGLWRLSWPTDAESLRRNLADGAERIRFYASRTRQAQSLLQELYDVLGDLAPGDMEPSRQRETPVRTERAA